MKKKLIIALMSVAGAGQVVADAPKLQDLNIRTVNILDIMRESEEGKKVSAEIEQLRKDLTNELETAQRDYMREAEEFKDKITAAAEEYKAKFATLSADARKQTEEKLTDLRKNAEEKLSSKRRDIENQAQKSEDKLKYTMQTVSDRLTTKAQAVIEKHAEENKLDLVLDTASGRPLYSSVKVDITSNMISGMNNEYKKELAQNKTSKPEATKVATKPAQNKAAGVA